MVVETVKRLFDWELYKLKKRGLWCIPAYTLAVCYLYFTPLAFYSIYDYLPWQNRNLLFMVGSWVLSFVLFIFTNAFYCVFYYFDVQKYKISPDKWPWETSKDFSADLKKLAKILSFNILVLSPILSWLFGSNSQYQTEPRLPGMGETVRQLSFFMIFEALWSYVAHRILHHPSLYGRIHKIHHEYTVTIAAANIYAHPIEFTLMNILAITIGPILYGQSNIHIITWFTWMTYKVISATDGHSGYEFPFSPFHTLPFGSIAEFHNYHHYKNIGNYSSQITIFDTLLGTDISFDTYRKKLAKEGKKSS